ncbi:unnamed protein product [Cuscuta europaea]|uniref:DUF8039 domain-containing protein n=1 Tax=Cuscuta europaea TaxID=41803 RepID=A0A9P0ZV66_CUSEU|nr:unnamed protein product [Cuscuta europaea]
MHHYFVHRGEQPTMRSTQASESGQVDTMNSTSDIPHKSFIDGANCRLVVESQTVNDDMSLDYVAVAVAYNTPVGALIHNVSMSDKTIKVNISMPCPGCDQCPLLFPNESADMYVIADAVGSFVQWPARLVIFEGEEPQFQHKKKEMKKKQTPFVERDPPKVTVAPSICPLVSESILDTLTDDVLELHEALQWFELENFVYKKS